MSFAKEKANLDYSFRECRFVVDDVKTLPETFDWREKKGVSKMKDQGVCGDCFVFAAVDALESQYLIHKQKDYDFSQQAMLNCVGHGCSGGSMGLVWQYIHDHGICENYEIPYKGSVSILH